MLAALKHIVTFQYGTAPVDQSHRVTAGVSVDAVKSGFIPACHRLIIFV
jgi:hypothetical protein